MLLCASTCARCCPLFFRMQFVCRARHPFRFSSRGRISRSGLSGMGALDHQPTVRYDGPLCSPLFVAPFCARTMILVCWNSSGSARSGASARIPIALCHGSRTKRGYLQGRTKWPIVSDRRLVGQGARAGQVCKRNTPRRRKPKWMTRATHKLHP